MHFANICSLLQKLPKNVQLSPIEPSSNFKYELTAHLIVAPLPESGEKFV